LITAFFYKEKIKPDQYMLFHTYVVSKKRVAFFLSKIVPKRLFLELFFIFDKYFSDKQKYSY